MEGMERTYDIKRDLRAFKGCTNTPCFAQIHGGPFVGEDSIEKEFAIFGRSLTWGGGMARDPREHFPLRKKTRGVGEPKDFVRESFRTTLTTRPILTKTMRTGIIESIKKKAQS